MSVNCHDLIAKKFAHKLNVTGTTTVLLLICFIHVRYTPSQVYWFLSKMKINVGLPIDRLIIQNMQWLLIKIKQCNLAAFLSLLHYLFHLESSNKKFFFYFFAGLLFKHCASWIFKCHNSPLSHYPQKRKREKEKKRNNKRKKFVSPEWLF